MKKKSLLNGRQRGAAEKTRPDRRRSPRRLVLEQLEERRLMSASPWPGTEEPYRPSLTATCLPAPQTLPDAFVVPPEFRQPTAQTSGWEAVDSPPAGQRPYGATSGDTSEYMLGDVWVTVVLLESNGTIDGNTEDWTATEKNNVKSQIQQGLQWWQDTLAAHPGLPVASKEHLTFHVDFTYADAPVATGYEPINRPYTDQGKWINDFLTKVGYSTGDYWSDMFTWDDAQRVAHNTDWAYTVFVADSSNDADGEFSGGHSAYAYLGGPFTVMTYDNGNWGIDRMRQVFAHETGHIFYALDEYPGSDSYDDHSGYYNTRNLNASDGHPNPTSRVDSLMAEATRQTAAYSSHTSSPTSLQMLGWQDTDNDGIFDVLDVPLTLTTGSGSYNAATGQFEFTGSSSVQTLPNNNPESLRHAITLNKVDRLQYQLDGGAWIDGHTYDGYSNVAVAQNVAVGGGNHTLRFRTKCTETGLTSNEVSFDVSVPLTTCTVTPSSAIVSDAQAGVQTFNLTVACSAAMDTAVPPTVSFPTAGEDPTTAPATLRFNSGSWTNNQTYVARFDVTDQDLSMANVDVRVAGAKDAAGNMLAAVTAADKFSIDTANPTATVVAVVPDPRATAVEQMTIEFGEPVSGLDVADLALTRDNGANLLTAAQTLTTTDSGRTWVLANLQALTGSAGTYQLRLAAAGSDVHDLAGNVLKNDAVATWTCVPDVPHHGWAKAYGQAGSVPNDSGEAIATDTAGNVYVTGLWGYSDVSGGRTMDFFVAKYTVDGALEWQVQIGATGDDRSTGIAVAPDGHVYVTGYFQGTVDFDPLATHDGDSDVLKCSGLEDIFVLALDANGRYEWARRFGQANGGYDRGSDVEVGADGRVYVGGCFSGRLDFDPAATHPGDRDIVNCLGGYDAFVLALDANGSCLWAAAAGGAGYDAVYDLTVGRDGCVYATGVFEGEAGFDPNQPTHKLAALGVGDAFVWKLDSGGQYVAAVDIGDGVTDASNGYASGNGIALDSQGSVYTTGRFNGEADFDPDATATVSRRGNNNSFDMYALKLDSSLQYQWVQTFGSWGFDHGLGLAIDASDDVLIAGYFQATVDFDPSPTGVYTLTSPYAADIRDGYLLELTAAGAFVSAREFGGDGDDQAKSLVVTGAGAVAVTGYFSGTVDFDHEDGTTTLTSAGGTDAFTVLIPPGDVPVAPTVTVAPLVTNRNQPTITGTVRIAESGNGLAGLTVRVGGQTLTATVSGEAWSVTVPAGLADGTYDVEATATDNAGNSGRDATSNELTVDTAGPTATVGMLVTSHRQPTLTGTVADPSPSSGLAGVTVVVGGQTLTARVAGGTWSVTVPTALADGTCDVQATATDKAGNSGTDATNNELTVDTAAPAVTVATLVANNNRPTLSGTVTDPAPSSGLVGVTVVVGGQTLTATVSGGAWNATVPTALADGTYDVRATATDMAGNSAGDTTTNELTVDTTVTPTTEIEVAVRLVKTLAASDHMSDASFEDYPSLDSVPVGSLYHAEVWLRDRGTARGIAGGGVDLSYPTALMDATALAHGSVYNALTSGTIDDAHGLVDNLAGGTFNATEGTTEWVRLGSVTLQALAVGDAVFTVGHDLSPGTANSTFAEVGAGSLDWRCVQFPTAPVTVRQLQSNVQVHLVPRITKSTADTSASLPTEDRSPFQVLEGGNVAGSNNFFVEVWVRSDPANPAAISGGSVNVGYNPRYATVVAIEHGSVFTTLPIGDIDNTAGVVSLGGGTLATDKGVQDYVLLGRIEFQGNAPVDEAARQAGPYSAGLNATAGPSSFAEVGLGNVGATFQPAPAVYVKAVVYDIDDSAGVDFGDFSYFVPAFGQTVRDTQPPFTWWADFDASGVVDFGDFSYFVTAFNKRFNDGGITFPATGRGQSPTAPAGEWAGASPVDDEPAEIDVELRLVTSPAAADHLTDTDFADHASVTSVPLNRPYYAEMWLRDAGTDGGLAGGTLDLTYTTALADATGIDRGSIFNVLNSGTIDDAQGLVDNLGGGTFMGGVGTQQWVRLGTVTLVPTAAGAATFALGHDMSPGAGNPSFAKVGAGSTDWSLIQFHGTPVTVWQVASHPWQNPDNAADVNADGDVTPVDVLTVINHINSVGSGRPSLLPDGTSGALLYLDVTGDDEVSPVDVLAVINYINSHAAAGQQPMQAAAGASIDADWQQTAPQPGRLALAIQVEGELVADAMNAPSLDATPASEWDQLMQCLSEHAVAKRDRDTPIDQVFAALAEVTDMTWPETSR